jgi:hypothetical protein
LTEHIESINLSGRLGAITSFVDQNGNKIIATPANDLA